MKLIENLGSKYTGKDKATYGLFECEFCKSAVEKKLSAGKTNKTCGSVPCMQKSAKLNTTKNTAPASPYYRAFQSKYTQLNKNTKVQNKWLTMSAFYADMYSEYVTVRETCSKVAMVITGDVANKDTVSFVGREPDSRLVNGVMGIDYTNGVPDGVHTTGCLASLFNQTHKSILRRLDALKSTPHFGDTFDATITTGKVRKRKQRVQVLNEFQYSTLKSALTITQSKNVPDSVYVVTGGELTKIGISSNVENRFCKLTTSSPVPLTLVAFSKVHDARQLEKELHHKYSMERTHGEWFKLSQPQIDEAIALIKAA